MQNWQFLALNVPIVNMEYAGLEISVNSRIASSFSLQIANVNAGAVTVSIVRPVPNVRFLREVSDWSIIHRQGVGARILGLLESIVMVE